VHRFLIRASLVAAALALILVAATAATGAGKARDGAPSKSGAVHTARWGYVSLYQDLP
jgi:hypothetical protein